MSGYQSPSPSAARPAVRGPPRVFVLSPQRHHWVLTEYKVLLELCNLSEPEMRLAGLRFIPSGVCAIETFYDALSFQDLQGQVRAMEIRKPRAFAPSTGLPTGKYLGLHHNDELWLAEVATAQARRLAGRLNQVNGTVNFRWMRDSSGLLAQFVPAGQGPPRPPAVPGSPIVQPAKPLARPGPSRTS